LLFDYKPEIAEKLAGEFDLKTRIKARDGKGGRFYAAEVLI
jgi:hypothetical protein